jgi:outer membrane protein OmpA-like peptidoglycan-associated protein
MKLARALAAIAIGIAIADASAHGQSLFDKMKKKAKDKAAETGEKTIDKAAESATSPSKKPDTTATAAAAAPAAANAADDLKPGQGAWANYDFKPGEHILYADDFMQDEVGDFPRRLEFASGTMDIVEWQKSRWLRLTSTSRFLVPLAAPLPERYTLEFDYAVPAGEMWIYAGGEEQGGRIVFGNGGAGGVGGDGPQAHAQPSEALLGKVVRARVMADGKYVKVYVNDKRIANVPNFDPVRGNKILFHVDANEENPSMFGNFRIAAGGKKLYDALAEKGRVATQGIYFDTGSDRIRPESSPTLKEIAAMLTDHAELKLLIEGHTDNVGAAAANQALSERRAAAVRQALMDGYGVAGERLTTKGLGATKPAGGNDTPEGRQNNRRVELVKV